MNDFRRYVGTTIQLLLVAPLGVSTAVVTGVTARLVQTIGGDDAAEFAVAPRAAGGGLGAGWTLTIAAALSGELAPGEYEVRAHLALVGGGAERSIVGLQLLPFDGDA